MNEAHGVNASAVTGARGLVMLALKVLLTLALGGWIWRVRCGQTDLP